MKERKQLFIGYYNKSVILTYIGIILSICGILNVLGGNEAESVNRVTLSMIFLILAGICDLFDGVIARRCDRTEQEKAFGIQIDSLADIVSFVLFPAIILAKTAHGHVLLVLTCILYILAGIIRLAYFNITTEENKGFFKGLPVTFSSMIIPIIYVITLIINKSNIASLMIIVYLIIAFAFVANFKLKKPSGIMYIVFSLLAIFTIVGLLLF